MANFKDILRMFRDADTHMDSCERPDERHYDWGTHVDLCGMSVEDYISTTPYPLNFASGGGSSTSGSTQSGKTDNEVTISLEGPDSSGEYELTLVADNEPKDEVFVTLYLDGTKYTASMPAGVKNTSTCIKLSSKFASLSNVSFVSNDSEYKYTYISTIKSGLYTLTYVLDGETYKTSSVKCGTALTIEENPTKEGYTFSGWDGFVDTMPEGNLTITGTFTVNEHTLTYKVDGVEYSAMTVAYGTALTAIEEPTKEGYTFSGWSEVPATMPDSDVNITGTFTVNSYTLTYVVSGETVHTDIIAYSGLVTPYEAPVYEGYTFDRWDEIPTTMPAKDVTVNGVYTLNEYTITYLNEDKTEYKSELYYYGDVVSEITAPTKEGYTFSGWSETIPATMPAKDIEVTAVFTVNSYVLTYKVDGVDYSAFTYDYGTSLTAIAEPTKEGYTFSGWSEVPATMPAKDTEVTGTFSINSYTLTYKVDGADYSAFTYEYATVLTAIAEPTKEGYTFSGWSEVPTTMPAKDVEITGTFAVNSYALIYKVDGVGYAASTVAYGTTLTVLAEPTKDGYTFSGWSEVPATMPAKDVEITGTFTVNSYTLTYKVDGADYSAFTYDYGETIVAIAEPTMEGETFSGWSEIPATMPAHDVVVNGTFGANNYILTYKVDGVEYSSMTVTYGTALVAIAEPTKDGYTFSGWSEVPATMPAHNLEITGTFTVNSYTLTYKVDGADYSALTYEYATVLTAIAEPTKEGYTFSGWSEIPATMPAKDIEVTGTFTVNSYVLTYKVDGVDYSAFTYDYGTSLTAIAEPTKEGYTFSGWSEVPATMPVKNVEITGTFTINSHTVTFRVKDKDGNTGVTTSTLEYGASIIYPTITAIEGYTFEWTEVVNVMPDRDLDISGEYLINSYRLIVYVDGEEVTNEMVEYGSALDDSFIPTLEKRTGYTEGWDKTVPATMPANELTITAVYTPIIYTITFVVEGVSSAVTGAYNTAVTEPKQPERDGYTFRWKTTVPEKFTADMTIEGEYIENTVETAIYYGKILDIESSSLTADMITSSFTQIPNQSGETTFTVTLPKPDEYDTMYSQWEEEEIEDDEYYAWLDKQVWAVDIIVPTSVPTSGVTMTRGGMTDCLLTNKGTITISGNEYNIISYVPEAKYANAYSPNNTQIELTLTIE